MARFNIQRALGQQAAVTMARWEPLLDELHARSIPMQADQTEALIARLDRLADRPVDRKLIAFLTPCYCAFRLGAATLAHLPAEAGRNRAAARRYAARLGA